MHTQREQGGEMLAPLLGFNRSTFFLWPEACATHGQAPQKTSQL